MNIKPSKALAKAFSAYNAKARQNQTKPMQDSRLALFALIQTLTVVPEGLSDLLWDSFGDRTQSTARFRASIDAWYQGQGWVTRVKLSEYCASRSVSPRWENTLREAVRSYYSLELGDFKNFIVVPDKVDSEHAFIVRIDQPMPSKVPAKPKQSLSKALAKR